MRKRGLLVSTILLLLSLSLVSAGALGDAISLLGTDLVIVAVFLISYLIVYFALSRVFRDKTTGRVKPVIPGGIAVGVALLITQQVNKFNWNFTISNFVFDVGISGEMFEMVTGLISLAIAGLLIWWLKWHTLLIAGLFMVIAGIIGGVDPSLTMIGIGAGLILIYLFTFNMFRERMGAGMGFATTHKAGIGKTLLGILVAGAALAYGLWAGQMWAMILGGILLLLWILIRLRRRGFTGGQVTAKRTGIALLLLLVGGGALAFGFWAGQTYAMIVGGLLLFLWLLIRLRRRGVTGSEPGLQFAIFILLFAGGVLAYGLWVGQMWAMILGGLLLFLWLLIRMRRISKRMSPGAREGGFAIFVLFLFMMTVLGLGLYIGQAMAGVVLALLIFLWILIRLRRRGVTGPKITAKGIGGGIVEGSKKWEKWKKAKQEKYSKEREKQLQKEAEHQRKLRAQDVKKAEKMLSKTGHHDIKAITYMASKGKDVTEMFERMRERYLNEVRIGPSKRYKNLATEVVNLLDQFYTQWKRQVKQKQGKKVEQKKQLNKEIAAIVKQMGILEGRIGELEKTIKQYEARIKELTIIKEQASSNANILHKEVSKPGATNPALQRGENKKMAEVRLERARQAYKDWHKQYDLNINTGERIKELSVNKSKLNNQLIKEIREYRKLKQLYLEKTGQ